MKKFVNLLYTIIIPVIPLVLHLCVNIVTNISTKLENIYPELFFATISICAESYRTLQLELKYNIAKSLFIFIISLLSIISSVFYGSILVINNIQYNNVNIDITLIISLIIFFSSVLIHIAIIILREA